VVEKKTPAKSSGPMNKAEATAITQRIRRATDELYELVDQARQRQAWKPLGYSSWENYVKAEFDMSARHSYRLIDYAAVAREIDEVAGKNVTRVSQISVRDAAALKSDLPAAKAEIKARVDAGENPGNAVAETAKAKRAIDENRRAAKKAEQAKNEAHRQQSADALSQAVKDHQKATAEWKSRSKSGQEAVDVEALTAELEELREANAALEADLAAARAELKKFEDMRVQFDQGGFDKVIADKDILIQDLQSRVYSESGDKASWMKLSKFWEREAKKLGYSPNEVIDIGSGEVING